MIPLHSRSDSLSSSKQERFLMLLRPVHDRLESFALAMTRNPDDARDLVNETLLRAFEHFDEIRNEGAFAAWLLTTATRVWRRRRWRGRIFSEYDVDVAEAIPSNGSTPEDSADVAMLYLALARLPASQREAVVLFEISGLSLEDIRQIQGGSLSGVKSRIVRGRRRLAELLVDPERRVTPPSRSNSFDTSTGHERPAFFLNPISHE